MNFQYCKKLKSNGYCTKAKPFDEDVFDGLLYTARKCVYDINDLKLVPTKKQQYKLSNGCPFFEPVDGLEKMLEVLGTLEFKKKDYIVLEDELNYYLNRINADD